MEINDEGDDPSVDIGSSAQRRSMRNREEVVRIGGSVHVAADERVDGDVVAVGGSVRIDGEVDGDVVAVMGSVNLGPEATVYGDVVAVGGSVHKAPGAEIHGELVEAGFFGVGTGNGSHSVSRTITIGEDDDEGDLGEAVLDLVMILVLGLLASAAQLIGPKGVERVEAAAIGAPWKALLVGLLVEVFFVPAFVVSILVLAISIIGIPVLIIFIPSALLGISLAFLLGWAGISRLVGRAVRDRLDWSWADGRFRLFFVGSAALMFLTLFADLLAGVGGLIAPLALVIGIAGFLVEYAAWTGGLGAVVLTRFGTRDGNGGGGGGSFTGAPGSGGVHFAPDDEGLFDAKRSDVAPSSETSAPLETGGGVFAPPEQPIRTEEDDPPETRQD